MNLERIIRAGAVWAWPRSNLPLQEARRLYTVTGNPTVGHGKWGPYLTTDGTNDYFTLSAAEEVLLRFDSGTQDFSVVAWVRRVSFGALHIIINKQDGANDGWSLGILAGNQPIMGMNALYALGPTITDTLWHSVIGTVDRDGSILVYTDGVLGSPAAAGGAVMATTTAPRLGARAYDAGYKWLGDTAGIWIIDRALTAAEALGIATGKAF